MALNSKGQPTKTKPPSEPGTFVGEVKRREYRLSDRRARDVQFYRWDGRAWSITSGEEKTQASNDFVQQERQKNQKEYDARVAATKSTPESFVSNTLRKLPAPKTSLTTDGVLRYPESAVGGGNITEDSDYVLFEFYKYAPPFGGQSGDANFRSTKRVAPSPDRRNPQQKRNGVGLRRSDEVTDSRTNLLRTNKNYFDYNQSKDYDSLVGGKYKPIIMYMPEDISTGFKSNWGGKAFSNIASGLLKSAGGEGLNKLDNLANTSFEAFQKLPTIAGAAAIKRGIQKITGDSLSNDDIFGGISGAILNPNTELLYSGTDMRNFQLNFKMVPRNKPEAKIINEIIKIFKMCTLPSRDPGKVFGLEFKGIKVGFIGVPNLVKVSFMQGGSVHPVLPVYKMCAITQVDVNYTPDGSYATYEEGQPAAISLSINFQETKLVFEEEIANDSIR